MKEQKILGIKNNPIIIIQQMKNEEIIKTAKALETEKNKAKSRHPYNVFTAWDMNENDHTKLLLALLRYQGLDGRPALLTSFLDRFAKGRGGMIHYKSPKDVCIRFNPRFEDDAKYGFMDGLITFTANAKHIAVIIENKIYDAPDQDDQIRRYITHMTQEESISLDHVWVFYLTGDGLKEVDEKSYDPDGENEKTNIGSRFVSIDYKYGILKWLKEDVLEARVYPESLTAVVRAYVQSLEKDVFCGDDSRERLKIKLCDSLFGHHKLKALKEAEIDKLYDFREGVQKIRKEGAEGQDTDCVDMAYGVIKSVVFDVEQMAFDAFEKCSTEILNNQWKKELKMKGSQWMAKHRGVGGEKGFVQIGLSEEWGAAHLEWIPVNTKSMLWGNQYKLELHAEGRNNRDKADQWRKKFKEQAFMLPTGCTVGQSRTVLVYEVQTDKPIAKMGKKELESFLKKVYTEEMNVCCRLLVEDYGK